MSGSANRRLIPANTTLLQPGSKYYRINDALSAQSGSTNLVGSQIITLQGQVASLQSEVATLQSQVSTLQSQVATLQGQNTVFTAFMAGFNYNQTEVNTGTIFLDQRTIYKRSFVINNALNTALTVFTFAHGVANINYIVNVTAMAAQAGGQQLPITFINMATAPSINVGVSCWCDTANIYIACGGVTFSGYQVLVTLWYTATDR